MFCMSVSSQLWWYYNVGTYNDCRQHFERWQNCLKSRLKKPDVAKAMMDAEREESHTGSHVFLFRPEYAEEAQLRYGIEPPAPRAQHESMLDS